jgi:hypothetical protein
VFRRGIISVGENVDKIDEDFTENAEIWDMALDAGALLSRSTIIVFPGGPRPSYPTQLHSRFL